MSNLLDVVERILVEGVMSDLGVDFGFGPDGRKFGSISSAVDDIASGTKLDNGKGEGKEGQGRVS